MCDQAPASPRQRKGRERRLHQIDAPAPLDGAIRHPQPPRSPPTEFSVGLGPGNGSTCRRPARALDNAIRPPVPRPRLEMSHHFLRETPRVLVIPAPLRLVGDTGDQRRLPPGQRPPQAAGLDATPTRRTLGRGKPATPSALPVPSVQPASADAPTIEPTSNTCSIVAASVPAVTPESRRFGGRHTVGVTSFKRGGEARSANNQGLWRSW